MSYRFTTICTQNAMLPSLPVPNVLPSGARSSQKPLYLPGLNEACRLTFTSASAPGAVVGMAVVLVPCMASPNENTSV